MTFSLIMPAAGSGSRLGAALPKALLQVAGTPLFIHALRPFMENRNCRCVVIAAPEDYVERFRTLVDAQFSPGSIKVVAGGSTRQESVAKALEETSTETGVVLVHDAARPLVSGEVIERVLGGLDERFSAVVPGVKVPDTLKRGTGDPLTVEGTVDRSQVYAIQTPQAIRREILRVALELAVTNRLVLSDDAGLIEHFNLGMVRIVAGDPDNFKVTMPSDLARAERMLLERA